MKKTIIAVGMLFAMTMSATIHAQESGKKENEEGFCFYDSEGESDHFD